MIVLALVALAVFSTQALAAGTLIGKWQMGNADTGALLQIEFSAGGVVMFQDQVGSYSTAGSNITIDGWNGAVFQMFAHGVMTGLFFALVGLVYEKAHSREIFEMGGFAAKMPAIAVFFTIACLSSLGLPGMAGFAAELLVFLGAWNSDASWWAVPGILGAVITAFYVLRVSRAIFWGEGPSDKFPDLEDCRGTEWVAPVMLTACILLFGLVPDLLLRFIDVATVEHLGWLGVHADGLADAAMEVQR